MPLSEVHMSRSSDLCRRLPLPWRGIAVVLLCATTSALHAQRRRPAETGWPSYNRTLAGERYSPLTQIGPANVGRLKVRCTYTLPEVSSLQTGMLVVGRTMYFTTDTISYAIDAATCREVWRRARHNPSPSALLVNRGFAYLDGRLFRGTSDAYVLALDAATGRTLWEHKIDEAAPGVTIPMAPIAANGMVFIGNAGGDQTGVTGHVYALDPKDGHVIWKFNVVPDTGAARATWTNPRLPISGGAFWTSFTYDAEHQVLYVPAGNPAPDFDIELRTGDNLYSNSVIALDARTGAMLGYNQLVKRDNHDWDVDAPAILVTTRSGRRIVASSNKDGLLSILDRSQLTVRDRPAAADPSGMLPLLSQTPTTTRENVDVPLRRDRATRFCPGILGGSEWNGPAYSPTANTIFVGAVDWCASARVADSVAIPALGATWLAAGNLEHEALFDAPEKAMGWVSAFDAENGAVRWRFRTPRPVLAAVTPTASGLVFAADLGGTLYALESSSGRVLWRTNTGQSTGGGVITYSVAGRQLLGIASGMRSPVWPGGADQSRILVYGLP